MQLKKIFQTLIQTLLNAKRKKRFTEVIVLQQNLRDQRAHQTILPVKFLQWISEETLTLNTKM